VCPLSLLVLEGGGARVSPLTGLFDLEKKINLIIDNPICKKHNFQNGKLPS
jgi:hypothetical protein